MTLSSIFIATIFIIVPFGGFLGNLPDKCGGDTGGVYIDGTIYVCKDGDTKFYKYHEVGHKIYNELLSEAQRKEYIAAYEKDRKLGIRAFYRDYGLHDVEEDFADNVGLIGTKQAVKIGVKKRMKLIERLISEIK